MSKTLKVEDEQGYAPTRETARKRRYDTIGWLYRKGRLTSDQLSAAVQIRQAFEAITADVQCRGPSYEDQGRPPKKSGPRPTPPDKPGEVDLQLAYSCWLAEMARRYGSPPDLRYVFAIIIDGVSCRQADRAYGWRNGTAAVRLKDALDVYLTQRGHLGHISGNQED